MTLTQAAEDIALVEQQMRAMGTVLAAVRFAIADALEVGPKTRQSAEPSPKTKGRKSGR